MLEIMKDQQYVCIAGNYLSRAEVTRNHKNEIVHTWVFEMIKTKKDASHTFKDSAIAYEWHLGTDSNPRPSNNSHILSTSQDN